MLNKKAQVGETVTWIVATVIIVFVLLFFIFGASMLAQTKNIKSYRENAFASVTYQGDDLFLKKNLFTYFGITKDLLKKSLLRDLDQKAAAGEFLFDYNDTKKEMIAKL